MRNFGREALRCHTSVSIAATSSMRSIADEPTREPPRAASRPLVINVPVSAHTDGNEREAGAAVGGGAGRFWAAWSCAPRTSPIAAMIPGYRSCLRMASDSTIGREKMPGLRKCLGQLRAVRAFPFSANPSIGVLGFQDWYPGD